MPFLQRPRRNDVGMPGEDHERLRVPVADPQVHYVGALEDLGLETERHEALDDDLLAAGVLGRDRLARDQRLGELEGFVLHAGWSSRKVAKRESISMGRRAARTAGHGGADAL